MDIKQVTLIDPNGDEITDHRLNNPEYMILAKFRTAHIVERHNAHAVSIEDAVAFAYLQGQFDVILTLQEKQSKKTEAKS